MTPCEARVETHGSPTGRIDERNVRVLAKKVLATKEESIDDK
jgi:hypothetical protein